MSAHKIIAVDFGGECPGKFESWRKDLFFAPWKVGSASIAPVYTEWVNVPAPYRELRLELIGFRRSHDFGFDVVPAQVWTRFFMS